MYTVTYCDMTPRTAQLTGARDPEDDLAREALAHGEKQPMQKDGYRQNETGRRQRGVNGIRATTGGRTTSKNAFGESFTRHGVWVTAA